MDRIYTLKNGLRFIFIQNKYVRSVALGVFVSAGSVYEQSKNNGVSHFIEHMSFKGTPTRSAFDIVNEIDSIGAKINAFTTKHYTCYYTISLEKNVQKCAQILSDLYFNSLYNQEELEKERNVILEEFSESKDTPDSICLDNLSSAFFKGHPLSYTILGSKGSIQNISREDLLSYKEKLYTADNTAIVMVGDITAEKAMDIVEQYFSCFSHLRAKRRNLKGANYNTTSVKRVKRSEQSHLAIAFPGLPFSDARVSSLELMCLVFGLEMSSRLFQSIRERYGLCYTIYSYPSLYLNEGMLTIYTSVNPKNIERATSAIKDEINLLLKEGITPQELNKGKEQMKTGLVISQESTIAVMRSQGRNLLFKNELFDIDKKIQQIDALQLDEVNSVAKDIFDTDTISTSMVGPKSEFDALELLKN